ncbi:hypothetical protein BDR22DRAFT_886449 [Usnea florida]
MTMPTPAPRGAPRQKPFAIVICGGGLAGLALAIDFLRRNVPFHLYEYAHAFSEVGAGVAFGPNALGAMSLIDPKIRQGYTKRATSNASKEKQAVCLNFCAGMDCGIGKAGEKVATLSVEDVGNNEQSLEIEELDDGVKSHFADAGTTEANAAIKCNSVKSTLRLVALGTQDAAAQQTFTTKYAYRGLIPMEKAVALLGDSAKQHHVAR